MGFWRKIRFASAAAEMTENAQAEPRVQFSVLDGPWSDGGVWRGMDAATNRRVSREEALQVPAVMKARNLIAGATSAIPLRTIDRSRNEVDVPLLRQIDRQVPNVVTLAATFEDLLFEGVAWWRIKGFGWDDYPVEAEHIEPKRVHVPPVGKVRIDGLEVDDAELIRFDSPNPALLVHCARAIRRALRFEKTAEQYANSPRALGYFTPTEGADPADDDGIRDLLNDWDAARRVNAVGYVPAALKYNEMGMMTATDLQLVQLQERAALDIANATGIDPVDLGVNVTSRNYANATDRRRDRINDVLAPYMRAITDRLSMGDVTKRGQQVVFDLDDFLRADPATRWSVYETAVGMQAMTVEEVRAEEGRPALNAPKTPAPAVARPPAPQVQASRQEEVHTMRPDLGVVSFSDSGAQTFTFETAEFKVSAEKRTISGLLLPYGPIGRNRQGRWRFAPGSIEWNKSAVSRVKLNREHERVTLLGAATEIRESEHGVSAAFKVARGPLGDQALMEAEDSVLDGLSAEVDILDYTTDPVDADVYLVTKARLTGAGLTGSPGFDDARVTSVAASRHAGRESTMDDATTGQTAHAAPAAAPDTQAFTDAVQAFTMAVERLGKMPQEQREVVSVSRATVREPLVYSLNGQGHSFVRDAWEVRRGAYGSPATADAFARLKKYEEQSKELADRAALQFANAGNTTDQAQIIPPGYRPDLYVGQIPQGRPLFEAMSRGTLANATPFKVPVWVGSANLNGTNSEGTGPSTGTITDHTYRTVSPTAQSGEFIITRELVDSANPAIDQIAMAAMREEYAQDTESVIATALAAATDNDTGSGQSTEGCYVYTATGTGNDLAAKIRQVEGEFPFHRYTVAPNRVLASSGGWGALVQAVDDVGRPLFPFAGAMNALGTVGQGAQSMNIDGLPGVPAWALSNTYNDIVVFNSVDAWAWESTLLQFRFEEKSGPENIVLNIWGYFAFQILRYTGIHSIAYTAV